MAITRQLAAVRAERWLGNLLALETKHDLPQGRLFPKGTSVSGTIALRVIVLLTVLL